MDKESTPRHIELKDLEVYQLARQLSTTAWKIYLKLKWQDKKTMGDQFISSVDSVGANIAEGYGRYHYLDRIKFYYYARGSFMESRSHWLEILYEREKVNKEEFEAYCRISNILSLKLNNLISSVYQAKNKALNTN